MTGQENERSAPLYLYEKGERSMIEQVMLELHEVFDYTTPEEAAAYYERSPY